MQDRPAVQRSRGESHPQEDLLRRVVAKLRKSRGAGVHNSPGNEPVSLEEDRRGAGDMDEVRTGQRQHVGGQNARGREVGGGCAD